jgi:antitoxin component of MazEF toxin-antitoxin module
MAEMRLCSLPGRLFVTEVSVWGGSATIVISGFVLPFALLQQSKLHDSRTIIQDLLLSRVIILSPSTKQTSNTRIQLSRLFCRNIWQSRKALTAIWCLSDRMAEDCTFAPAGHQDVMPSWFLDNRILWLGSAHAAAADQLGRTGNTTNIRDWAFCGASQSV